MRAVSSGRGANQGSEEVSSVQRQRMWEGEGVGWSRAVCEEKDVELVEVNFSMNTDLLTSN